MFLNQVVMIADFSLLGESNPNTFKPQIASLNIEKYINSTTLANIEVSRSSLTTVMKGFNQNESNEALGKRFKDVLDVFRNLDKQINISLIYNTFY